MAAALDLPELYPQIQPIRRVCDARALPFSPTLEQLLYPSAEKIADAARRAAGTR